MTVASTTSRHLTRIGAAALDLILPPRCLDCGEPVARQAGLCAACWSRLNFLGPPCCACCGLPFAFDAGAALTCGACLRAPPSFARARAALAYGDAAARLIIGFKHGDQTHAAGIFAGWMARAGADLLAEAELLAPVPLHRNRLLRRRYNQSALLALALARLSGVRPVPDLLLRRRATPSQGGLSRAGRQRNVAGAFAVRPRRRDQLAGRRVLLVDDVLTTGATVQACADVMLRAGARQVDVLTIARVLRPLD